MENKEKTISRNRKLALTGAFSALIIIMTFVPNLGFIQFSPMVSITILQIPVILTALLAGLPGGIFAGFIMGLMSLIKAAMSPSGILDPLFVNPLCSVLPRMLLGAIAWGVWKLLKLIPKFPSTVAAGISGFAATFAHTLLVYGCIFIFAGADMREALAQIGMAGYGYLAVVGAGIVNELLEAVASTVVCTAVFAGIFIASSKKSKLSAEQDTEED